MTKHEHEHEYEPESQGEADSAGPPSPAHVLMYEPGSTNGSEAPAKQAHKHGPNDNSHGSPVEFWEQHYYGAAPVWSGKVNRTLADTVAHWDPGQALDLGCGEGGDVLWLAERGWHATGIDLSETAVRRAREAALERSNARSLRRKAAAAANSSDLFGSAEFVAADLAQWVELGAEIDQNPGQFDLITASFLQSPVELPRESILRAAVERLAVNGHLVLLSHAAPPPWATGSGGGPRHFFTPEDELRTLGLGVSKVRGSSSSGLAVVTAEVRVREVTAPDGSPAQIDDTLIVVRRR